MIVNGSNFLTDYKSPPKELKECPWSQAGFLGRYAFIVIVGFLTCNILSIPFYLMIEKPGIDCRAAWTNSLEEEQ